ncbi:MAG TPA: PQQ-binding-like beta-propeller repeat protein [Pyrinomonadaceae bacterium]|jgi:opacity protein-like surface antigen
MKRTTLAATLFALALTFAPRAAAGATVADDARAHAAEFRRASKSSADSPGDTAAFEFEDGGFKYHVVANGNGRRTKGDKTRRFNLRLDGRDYVEGLRFAVYEGDLLLVCELYDGETRAGLVTLLEQPSMRALWRRPVPAAEVGEPLRDGRSLYLTAFGFVARLDLRTGEYVWRHEGLGGAVVGREASGAGTQAARPFNSFETPELERDAVLFRERPVYNPPRTLVVNRKTGDIIRID